MKEDFDQQQRRQEELMKLQKEEYEREYQGLQNDQVIWQENQKEKDKLVGELREVLEEESKGDTRTTQHFGTTNEC